MGMAGQKQLAVRREALLQLLQPGQQRIMGRLRQTALLVIEPGGVGLQLRQLPDLLLHDGARRARHIGRGIRGPVERSELLFGRFEQIGNRLVLAQDVGGLGDLP